MYIAYIQSVESINTSKKNHFPDEKQRKELNPFGRNWVAFVQLQLPDELRSKKFNLDFLSNIILSLRKGKGHEPDF